MSLEWEVFFDRCVREIAKESFVLDIGGGTPFQKEMKKYKNTFRDCTYYSLDYSIHRNPNIVGDIHYLPFKDETADAIICKSVLEHVPEPQKAVREMHRILREGGKIFVCLPFIYPYHASKPALYDDYYRFTEDGVKYMFQDFREVEIVRIRGYLGTINLFLPSLISQCFSSVANLLDKFIIRDLGGNVTSAYNVFAVK